MALAVVCELVLLAACAWAALDALRTRRYLAGAGFLLIGLAALLGALVYAGLDGLEAAHRTLSTGSGRLSLLLVAAGVLGGWRCGLVLLAMAAGMLLVPENLALVGNLLALLAIAWKGASRRWSLACAGGLLFLLAGLLVGTHGQWFGIARVDLFHLCLALAVLCWRAAGLRSAWAAA